MNSTVDRLYRKMFKSPALWDAYIDRYIAQPADRILAEHFGDWHGSKVPQLAAGIYSALKEPRAVQNIDSERFAGCCEVAHCFQLFQKHRPQSIDELCNLLPAAVMEHYSPQSMERFFHEASTYSDSEIGLRQQWIFIVCIAQATGKDSEMLARILWRDELS